MLSIVPFLPFQSLSGGLSNTVLYTYAIAMFLFIFLDLPFDKYSSTSTIFDASEGVDG